MQQAALVIVGGDSHFENPIRGIFSSRLNSFEHRLTNR
jgi:hypothetical protein